MSKADLFMNEVNKGNSHRGAHISTNLDDRELSTMELLDQGPALLSTEMLLNEPVRNLSVQSSLNPISFRTEASNKENNVGDELANFNNMKISDDKILINEYNISTPPNKLQQTQIRQNYNVTPLINDSSSDEKLLDVLPKLYNKIQVYLLNNEYSLSFLKRFQLYVGYLIQFGLDPLVDENILEVQDCVMGNFPLVDEMEFIIKKFLFKPDNLIMKLVAFESSKNNNILQIHFSLWRIRLVTQGSLELYEKFIKAKFLQKWSVSYNKYGVEYKEHSDDINEARLKEFAFDKIAIANDSLRRMNIVADTKFKQSIFLRLKKVYSLLQENGFIFTQRQDDIAKKLYFKKWLLKFRLVQYQPKTAALKRKIFNKMTDKYKIREEMLDKALYSRYIFSSRSTIHMWNSRLKKQNENNSKLLVLEDKFVKSKYLTVLSSSYRDVQMVEEYFYRWKVRSGLVMDMNRRALMVYDDSIKRKHFSKLRQQMRAIIELNERVELHLKIKTINKLQHLLNRLKELQTKEEEWSLIDRPIIQGCNFSKWKKSYAEARNRKFDLNLNIYSSQHRHRLKKKYFQIYHKQSVIINEHLNVIADDMKNRQLLKSYLNRTIVGYGDNRADYIYADNVKNNTVLKDIFTLWKFRIDELESVLNEVTNEKNLYLLSSYLRIWSMNHFKVARNERTVQLFRQRWERATLRGLIQLWKLKSGSSKLSNNEPFDATENNNVNFDREEIASTTSNISPHHIGRVETPRRMEATTAIPGSLRMRRYKMQEMISHYNRARIIPSPLKESSNLPNAVKRRLQPPNNVSPRGYIAVQERRDGSPGKLQFSDLTSLKPPSQSRPVKHRSQSVLNGSPERRPPLGMFSRAADNLD
ncbi:hypothetical protein C6P44_004796 [Monosporozyma unispora]|nr:hypothetical protein C6P44_004796 [Kazachstania unispora]